MACTSRGEIRTLCFYPACSARFDRTTKEKRVAWRAPYCQPAYNHEEAACGTMQIKKVNRAICIGDIHGNLIQLQQLWTALTLKLGEEELYKSAVIFLGDYCDRGPDTKGVIDFLLRLQGKRSAHPEHGGTFFCAGNHDFAMAAYLGVLPVDDLSSGLDLDATKPPEYSSGYWQYSVEGGMHYLGRRWGGSPIYDASETFRSYGIEMTTKEIDREKFCRAVPCNHKEFLANLIWVHEQCLEFHQNENASEASMHHVVCVHAGLYPDRSLDEQLAALRNRNLSADILYEDPSRRDRIGALVGRSEVFPMHPSFDGSSVLVSGHHGILFSENRRIVIDEGGGYPGKSRLQAIILPEQLVVSHDGSHNQC